MTANQLSLVLFVQKCINPRLKEFKQVVVAIFHDVKRFQCQWSLKKQEKQLSPKIKQLVRSEKKLRARQKLYKIEATSNIGPIKISEVIATLGF